MTLRLSGELKRKIAELLVVRASGHQFDSQRKYPLWELSNYELKILLENGLGGVILHGGSVSDLKNRCSMLKNWARHPILLCADVEEGVGQRFDGGSWFPPPMSLGLKYQENSNEALLLAEKYGKCIGNQARRCGLNWVLAPVCDVNSNSLNPVINMRAWGKDPQTVAELVSSFHKGLVSEGVLSCAKHFPGHGDTEIDSHLDLPIVDNDLSRLKEVELIPFQALIKEGVSSVMTAHILLRKIDNIHIATLSKKIVIELLRETLGFNGIVVTDALIMEAITNRYGPGEAAVMAFEAGADLILMPKKPFEAIDAIADSILNGKISMARLEQSLDRRNREISKLEKISLTSIEEDNLTDEEEFEKKDEFALSEKLLEISITIKNYSYISSYKDSVNLIRVDDIFPCPYLSNLSPAFLIPKELGYKNVVCHPSGVNPWEKNNLKEPLALDRIGKGPFLLQLFVRGNPFRGGQVLSEPWKLAVEQLQAKGLLSALIIYGSIYFWEDVVSCLNPAIPCAFSPGQMPAAQKKILQSFLKSNKEKIANKSNAINFTD